MKYLESVFLVCHNLILLKSNSCMSESRKGTNALHESECARGFRDDKSTCIITHNVPLLAKYGLGTDFIRSTYLGFIFRNITKGNSGAFDLSYSLDLLMREFLDFRFL